MRCFGCIGKFYPGREQKDESESGTSEGILERGRDASSELKDQVVTSYELGIWGEDFVTEKLEEEGYVVVARGLYMITTEGTVRIADIVAMKDGNITLVEVKVNGSRYSASQREKDASIASNGAWVNPNSPAAKRLWGTDIGMPYIEPAPTKVVRVQCEYLGWSCR